MSEVRNSTGKLIRQAAWPSPQDYNEALQIPSVSFGDPVLKASVPELDRFGLPRPNSGNFASVYKVHSGDGYYAVRCFLKDIVDQEQRYKLISDSVMNDDLPYTVGFEYQPEGILIRGSWYPILKMEWVEGATLDYFIESHRDDAACIGRLANSFFEMAGRLREAGVAHGDLQHGNVLVLPDGQLRLVDYDGFFVPAMAGWSCHELGHRNYQHPQRHAHKFDSQLDNFSTWIIYLSLRVLAGSSRRKSFCGGEDALIFKHGDFQDPFSSAVFKELTESGDVEIRKFTNSVLWLLQQGADASLELGASAPNTVPFVFAPVERKVADVFSARDELLRGQVNATWQENTSATFRALDALTLPRRVAYPSPSIGKPGKALQHFLLVAGVGLTVFALIPVLWCCFVLPFLICLLIDHFRYDTSGARERVLLETGAVAPGKVLEVRADLGKVCIEYIVSNAFSVYTETCFVDITTEQANTVLVGDAIVVFYDRTRPNHVVVYEFSPYKVAM